MIRAEALYGFAELVSELGGNPQALLQHARIDADVLTREDAFVPYRHLMHLLEHSADQLACPDFGLRLAGRQDVGILGPIAVGSGSCATLQEALAFTARFLFVHSSALRLTLKPLDDRPYILMSIELLMERIPRCTQKIELTLGVMHRMMMTLTNGRYHLCEVHMPHERGITASVHRKYFGCPVHYQSNTTGLVIPVQDLQMQIHEHNPQLQKIATDYLTSHFSSPQTSMTMRVRSTVRRLLGTGAGNHVNVAAALAMHPRTLQRRLSEEHATFDEIKDDVRRELAKTYLEQSLPLSHVTALLGYSEQSALTRSCHRWFGKPPTALRLDTKAETL